jgi:hypothetical protein
MPIPMQVQTPSVMFSPSHIYFRMFCVYAHEYILLNTAFHIHQDEMLGIN